MNSCSKTELRKFKARAGRRQPAEYIETLWGFKTGRDHDIQAIRLVPHRGTRNLCQPRHRRTTAGCYDAALLDSVPDGASQTERSG
jgi:hypothetical protein